MEASKLRFAFGWMDKAVSVIAFIVLALVALLIIILLGCAIAAVISRVVEEIRDLRGWYDDDQ